MSKEYDQNTLRRIRRNLFFLVVALVTIGFFWLISDYLIACFWAAVLAIIFFQFYNRLASWLKGRHSLAAGLTSVFILLIVIVPLVLLSLALLRQGQELVIAVNRGDLNIQSILNYINERLPAIEDYLQNYGITEISLREQISTGMINFSQTLGSRMLEYGGGTIVFFLQFTLMLYLLFFFLRDGRKLVRTIIETVPMGNVRERELVHRFASVARATLKGTLIVAIVQGTIGGLLFWFVGIPGALLWGVAMTFLSLLPMGGSGFIWIPASIFLLIQGHIWEGITVIIVGALIIGLVDNLLRPILVGRDTRMPDYLVLISTLGGITLFGLSGFILGPVVAALFITVWEMMGKEYGGNLS